LTGQAVLLLVPKVAGHRAKELVADGPVVEQLAPFDGSVYALGPKEVAAFTEAANAGEGVVQLALDSALFGRRRGAAAGGRTLATVGGAQQRLLLSWK
jgi:hypothetical protein